MSDTKISALPTILAQNALQASVLPLVQSGVSSAIALGDVQQYIGTSIRNYSTAAQTPAAATRTYIAGSALVTDGAYGTHRIRIGTMYKWQFDITKTAAGTASSTFDICFGTTQTTADTARVSFTKTAGTAAADVGIVTITAIVRGPLSASCIVSGNFQLTHVGGATGLLGHCTEPAICVNTISGAFDITTAGTSAGLCITTGASDAITIQQVIAEAVNL